MFVNLRKYNKAEENVALNPRPQPGVLLLQVLMRRCRCHMSCMCLHTQNALFLAACLCRVADGWPWAAAALHRNDSHRIVGSAWADSYMCSTGRSGWTHGLGRITVCEVWRRCPPYLSKFTCNRCSLLSSKWQAQSQHGRRCQQQQRQQAPACTRVPRATDFSRWSSTFDMDT